MSGDIERLTNGKYDRHCVDSVIEDEGVGEGGQQSLEPGFFGTQRGSWFTDSPVRSSSPSNVANRLVPVPQRGSWFTDSPVRSTSPSNVANRLVPVPATPDFEPWYGKNWERFNQDEATSVEVARYEAWLREKMREEAEEVRSTEKHKQHWENDVFSTPPIQRKMDSGALSLTLDVSNFDALYPSVTEIDLSTHYDEAPGSGEYCVIIDGLLSVQECEQWIRISEGVGYNTALLNEVEAVDIRNSGRCIIDDGPAAEIIHERIFSVLEHHRSNRSPALSGEFSDMLLEIDDDEDEGEEAQHNERPSSPPFVMNGRYPAVGINERFRFLRYAEGQYFKPHYDGSYQTPDGSRQSMVTCQIYLNEGFEGGATNILDPFDSSVIVEPVVPKTGRVLLFHHRTNHEGAELISGVKYAVRTEIMYEL